jgi:DNA-binding transcriptional MerR regulator
MTNRYTMCVSDVSRALGVSDDRVRQLDEELCPTRRENGHRRYDPSIVDRIAKQRGR